MVRGRAGAAAPPWGRTDPDPPGVKYSRVVCVLSGGGAKSAAHAGALKALEEARLSASHFVGTSLGAVVGACFAGGLTYGEVLQRIGRVTRRDVAQVAPGVLLGPLGKSLFRRAPLQDTIRRLVPVARFEELRAPLTITATDLATGELVLFGAGGRTDVPLHDALYASCALPVFYPPATLHGRRYADGGLRAVLPLGVAAAQDPDLVFAVYVGPSFQEQGEPRPGRPGLLDAHGNAMRVLMAAQAEAAIASWDGRIPLVLARPPVEALATFRVDRVRHYVEEGYRAAVRALERWRAGEK